ncbi:MAG: class I tRNA ligase family protein, partial [Solirubrobacteraceae bacterium]|nr:class I tRNA ligase family protein [Solirubrobacteraceae bacterium]
VSPRVMVERYGADTLRTYVLFMGPPDQDADWSDEGVDGMSKFIARLWRLSAEAADTLPAGELPSEPNPDGLRVLRKAHWAIDKITADLGQRFSFNTAIAAVMELLNELSPAKRGDAEPAVVRFALSTANSLLFPFAPHSTTDAYALLNGGTRLWEEPWPTAEAEYLKADEIELVCQVMGKVRGRVTAPADADDAELERLARSEPNVATHLDGKTVVKVIVVPGKLVNFVVR